MLRSSRRPLLAVVARVLLLNGAALFGGAAAGAAGNPSTPVPVASISVQEPEGLPAETESPRKREPVRRTLMGVIVGIRDQRIGVQIPEQDRPVIVGTRPPTLIRIDKQKATLDDLRVGDRVLIVGRPGPQGNLLAVGIRVTRERSPDQ